MTENTKLQDLLRKIRALRAKAESTNSEAEAAAAEGRRAADTVSFSKQVGAASRSSYMIGSK